MVGLLIASELYRATVREQAQETECICWFNLQMPAMVRVAAGPGPKPRVRNLIQISPVSGKDPVT